MNEVKRVFSGIANYLGKHNFGELENCIEDSQGIGPVTN